jgi:hypothetical protein
MSPKHTDTKSPDAAATSASSNAHECSPTSPADTGENLEVDAGCTTVLITIFDSSHRY